MTIQLDRERISTRPGIKWARHGPDVLALWVADMDLDQPPVVVEAITERIASGALGYDFYDQPIPVLEVFVERMRSAFGWETSTDQLIRIHDVIQGLQLCVDVLTAPGDGVVVQTPAYPPFFNVINGLGRRVVDNPLKVTDSGWELDLDHLESLAAEPNVTTLLLCNPHNPAGFVMSPAQVAAVVDIAERHDLLVLSDEIHCDLVFKPNVHTPVASVSELAAERTVTVTAATKSFNFAGLRMAFIHSASERYLPKLKSIDKFAIGGIGVLGQVATIAGWTKGQPWLDEVLAGLDANRLLLAELLEQHLPGSRYVPQQATYLAWLDLSETGIGDDPADRFLEEASVYLNSGHDFFPEVDGGGRDPRGNGCARLNFATDPQVITEAVTRMGSLLT